MSGPGDFEVRKLELKRGIEKELTDFEYARTLWPLVYILDDKKEAYVGETTDVYSRLTTHLKNRQKQKLSRVHLIASHKFNKSATLDIESRLIKYMAGDGKYSLINGNLGLANHQYYQKKEVYHHLFESIWDRLRSLGIITHSLEYIDNSDLFKYSPYKSLGADQTAGLKEILRSLLRKERNYTVVQGGAGTGKTIIAIFLFKLLNTPLEDFNFIDFGEDELEIFDLVQQLKEKYPKPRMALVIPMSSFRRTIQRVFKHIKGLSGSMVVGPSDVVANDYDIVVVDEAHRLRRRVNLGTAFASFDRNCQQLGLDKMTSSELEWILKRSEKAIFFYDQDQSIKPSDTRASDFETLKSRRTTQIVNLNSQFRVLGGIDYVDYVDKLLTCWLKNKSRPFKSRSYEFLLFDSIADMTNVIKSKENEVGLSRLVAGYAWPWISKEDRDKYDITIEGTNLRWNSESIDWVNSKEAINEVGCIHTTQGYDLNYAGVIFGNEISYDESTDEIFIIKENYHDRNGKQTIKDPSELKAYIINIYKTMLLRGIKGTFVYACDEKLRSYLDRYIPKYKKETKDSKNETIEVIPFKNSVPLYDLSIAAGDFSPPQSSKDVTWVPLPKDMIYSDDFFACRVVGNSMNKIIPDGSICLFRRYSGGSRNGKIVLIQLANLQDVDTGTRFTVKEYNSIKTLRTSEEWEHASITLAPLSYDTRYTPIILNQDESVDIKVVGIFECVLT